MAGYIGTDKKNKRLEIVFTVGVCDPRKMKQIQSIRNRTLVEMAYRVLCLEGKVFTCQHHIKSCVMGN